MESFNTENNFSLQKVQTKVIIETAFSKEIKIVLPKGQLMKAHKAPFPILIHVLEGKIELGIEGEKNTMIRGEIIPIEANAVHDLLAKENAIVRLTLSTLDQAERVENIVKN